MCITDGSVRSSLSAGSPETIQRLPIMKKITTAAQHRGAAVRNRSINGLRFPAVPGAFCRHDERSPVRENDTITLFQTDRVAPLQSQPTPPLQYCIALQVGMTIEAN